MFFGFRVFFWFQGLGFKVFFSGAAALSLRRQGANWGLGLRASGRAASRISFRSSVLAPKRLTQTRTPHDLPVMQGRVQAHKSPVDRPSPRPKP